MRKIFGIAAFLLLAPNAFASDVPVNFLNADDQKLMLYWAVTGEACRGGSVTAETETALKCRDKALMEIALISRGYCIDEASKTLWSKGSPKNDWGGCKPE